MTIVSALLALCASTKNWRFALAGIPAVAIFWLLDGYYLQQERRYRGLYRDATAPDSSIELFDMDASRYKGGNFSYQSVLGSQTIWTLYCGLLAVLVAVMAYALA